MHILSNNLVFTGKLHNDGDWEIDYSALVEYKEFMATIKNDGYIFEFRLVLAYENEGDDLFALATGFEIMDKVFKLKEHKKYDDASVSLKSYFNNGEVFTGFLENGNYGLDVHIERKIEYCL